MIKCFNITLLPFKKFGKLIDEDVFQQHEKNLHYIKGSFLIYLINLINEIIPFRK